MINFCRFFKKKSEKSQKFTEYRNQRPIFETFCDYSDKNHPKNVFELMKRRFSFTKLKKNTKI